MNNLLQYYIKMSVENALNNDESEALQKSLLEGAGLCEFLLKMSRELEFKFSRFPLVKNFYIKIHLVGTQ